MDEKTDCYGFEVSYARGAAGRQRRYDDVKQLSTANLSEFIHGLSVHWLKNPTFADISNTTQLIELPPTGRGSPPDE